MRKLVEKPEHTRRLLNSLELQIKKIYEVFLGPQGTKLSSDDAMLIRKPLGGYSCATCEKGLTDLFARQQQIRMDYMNWSKFPSRDQSAKRGRNDSLGSKTQRIMNATANFELCPTNLVVPDKSYSPPPEEHNTLDMGSPEKKSEIHTIISKQLPTIKKHNF